MLLLFPENLNPKVLGTPRRNCSDASPTSMLSEAWRSKKCNSFKRPWHSSGRLWVEGLSTFAPRQHRGPGCRCRSNRCHPYRRRCTSHRQLRSIRSVWSSRPVGAVPLKVTSDHVAACWSKEPPSKPKCETFVSRRQNIENKQAAPGSPAPQKQTNSRKKRLLWEEKLTFHISFPEKKIQTKNVSFEAKKKRLHEHYHLPPTTYHLPPTTYHLPPTTYHLPPTTYHLPPTTYHLPPTTCHLPPATCHLPPTTCHLPPTTYHLPPTTYHLRPTNLLPTTCYLLPTTTYYYLLLPTTFLLPTYYLPTTYLLPTYYLTTTLLLPYYYLTTTLLLPYYYLTTTLL